MDNGKLYRQEHYRVDSKEQQEAQNQADNVPIKDGFFRASMNTHQPSELKTMTMEENWGAESDNIDIERTR